MLKKREFVMLAHKLKLDETNCPGWWMSEKLDGMYALWDGGLSRGLKVEDIPWANRNKDTRNHICTGLWSRYGKVIHCPEKWAADLPKAILAGELWMGRGRFQATMSVARNMNKSMHEWKNINYLIYDAPPVEEWLKDGRIHSGSFKSELTGMMSWAGLRGFGLEGPAKGTLYLSSYAWLKSAICDLAHCSLVQQTILPYDSQAARTVIDKEMERVLGLGGEGLIVRDPIAPWIASRSYKVLKYKPFETAQGRIISYVESQKEPGYVGAFTLISPIGPEGEDVQFEIANGFTDEQRRIERFEEWKGKTITYRYRELTVAGIPKEARYVG